MHRPPPLPPSPAPGQSTRAFTLLELTVVVVISAVLLGMLASGLLVVRQSARSAQCLGCLRQYQLANLSYAGDYDGQYVPVCGIDAAGITDWSLSWNVSGSPPSIDFMSRITNDLVSDGAGTSMPRGLLCPLAAPRWLNRTYGLNTDPATRALPTNPTLYRSTERTLRNAADIIAFADALDLFVGSPNAAAYWSSGHAAPEGIKVLGGTAYRHRTRANVVHFDGHAASYPVDELSPATTHWH